MTKLTKEQVKFFIETMTDDMHNTTQHEIAETLLSKFDECESLQAKLLAYEQAAKNPVGKFVFEPIGERWHHIKHGEYQRSEPKFKLVKLFSAPVLPKQPELIGMKVSIDTGSDNIGHRLFGEIVGTSDSNGVPVLCIEVAENNGVMASPAQPVIPERPELRYGDNVLWFLNELAAFDASDIDSDDFDVYGEDRNGMEGCATISITELAADAAKLLSAQPVSEPYKLPDGNLLLPQVPTQAHLNSIAMRYRHDFYLLNDTQKQGALAVARQMYEECSGQGFYIVPAAPAQEQK